MSTSGYIDQTAAQWAFYNYNTWLRGGIASPYNAENLPITNRDVDAQRPELEQAMPKYTMIRDCLLGQENIKMQGELYLPRPNEDIDIQEDERYRNYIKRAVFLNATGHTQRAVVGKLFAKQPTIELPQTLNPLLKDANGDGLAFDQLLEKCVAETFAFGRCGVYADFRATGAEMMSIADAEQLAPTLTFVAAEDIINWQIDKATKKVVLVVVREQYEDRDGYAVRLKSQYRVWQLVNGVLRIRVHRARRQDEMLAAQPTDTRFEVVEEYTPMLPGGRPWNIIPFVVMGSVNNDWDIDEPPLYQISVYDIALFRNSADIEEAAFLVGQPTLVISNVTQEWADKNKGFKLGSGRVLVLPDPDSKAMLLQASPDTLIDRLIEEKHKILRNLGAVFVEDMIDDNQTATGAVYQALQTHAPLISTSRNVIEGVHRAVGYAAMFLGIDPETEDIKLKLNSNILDNPLGVTGIQTSLQLWKDGAIAFDELREQLSIQDITLHTPDEALAMIEEEGLGRQQPVETMQQDEPDFMTGELEEEEEDMDNAEE